MKQILKLGICVLAMLVVRERLQRWKTMVLDQKRIPKPSRKTSMNVLRIRIPHGQVFWVSGGRLFLSTLLFC